MKHRSASTGQRTKRIATALTLLLAGLGISAAQVTANTAPRDVDTIYDFYLGGIKAGELSIDADMKGDRYHATSILKTAGIVGLVYKASFEAETEGRLTPTGLVPERFLADSRMSRKEQRVEMRFAGNAPREVLAQPKFDPRPWQIDPTEQVGALDPITAAISALAPAPKANICNRSVQVFDGRRRYAIDLGAPVKDGDRIKCPAVYRRIAGFKPKMMRKRPKFPFSIWYEERSDGLAHVVRGAGDSMFGLAVILLRN